MKPLALERITLSWDTLADMLVDHERSEMRIAARKLRKLGVSWKIITEATGVNPADLRGTAKS